MSTPWRVGLEKNSTRSWVPISYLQYQIYWSLLRVNAKRNVALEELNAVFSTNKRAKTFELRYDDVRADDIFPDGDKEIEPERESDYASTQG